MYAKYNSNINNYTLNIHTELSDININELMKWNGCKNQTHSQICFEVTPGLSTKLNPCNPQPTQVI